MPLAGVLPWTNQPIELFHGTTDVHAGDIFQGVDETAGAYLKDFGRGFYTTTSLAKARDWAHQKTVRYGGNPAVIRFDVDRNDLAPLDCLFFVRGDKLAADYWSFVQYCRTIIGDHNRQPQGWYDIVVGPVSGSWKKQTIISDHDQISFHTPKASTVLNSSPKREV